jgi:hypothetical protein
MKDYREDSGAEHHPVRGLFRRLTERGMGQTEIRDEDSIRYVSSLMSRFVRADSLYQMQGADGQTLEYLVDMFSVAGATADPALRLRQHQYLGDFTLFMLGIFPEHLERSRRPVLGRYYAAQGSRAYSVVADLTEVRSEPALFRRLAGRFDEYVAGLNWVRLYIRDPFFQYTFREFHIT